MDNIDNFQNLISNIDTINQVEEILNRYDVFNCARLYLSALFIIYFPTFHFEVENISYCNHSLYRTAIELTSCNSKNIAEYISKYKYELTKWKEEDVNNKISELHYMKNNTYEQELHCDKDIDRCYDIQLKILDVAHNYFEKKKMK